MTRKQRSQAGRNITYDLSNPRNVAAFEALLEDDDADETVRSKPSKATRQQQAKKKREKEKFFQLKHSAAADDTSSPQQDPISHLMDMFEGIADRALVTDVYHASGSSLEAAAEALFALLGTDAAGAGGPSSHTPPAASGGAASSSSAWGAPSSSAGARAAAAALHREQQQQQVVSCMSWHDLPPDVRSSILSQLTPQDLARAASTCSEFRDWANAMRAHVRHLVLQPGLSYSCLRGMVSSHVAAAVMDFTRFERHIQHKDPAELLPQVVAMHKAEAEASLFRGLVAVAEGSVASCRTTPVTGLVLRGLVGATDRVVAEALQALKGLRSLDLTHCPNITNKSFYLIAKYKATQGLAAQDEHQQQQQDSYQQQQQQQELAGEGALDADGDQELMYGWARSSSSSEDDSDSSSSSGPEDDDAVEDQEARGSAAAAAAAAEATRMPAAAAAAAAAAVDDTAGDRAQPDGALEHESRQQQQQEEQQQQHGEQQQQGEGNGEGQGQPCVSAAASTTRASAVARELAALEIKASVFWQPQRGETAADAAAAAADVGAAAAAAAPPAPVAAVQGGGVGFQELKVGGSRGLLDDGLRQVLQHPVIKHSLSRLDVSGCRSITAAGLIIPPLGVLRELRACRCSGLKQLVVHLPGSHPLSSLDLSSCHYLQLVDLGLIGLTHLNLSNCRTLYRLRMRCPSLQSLSLAQCGALFDFHEDAWQVPALQQLNLFGARRASGSQLQVVLDRLPGLKWISLNGCYGINTLHLTRNLELESVDLSGCRFLTAFSCASPSLQQLTAASCSRLHSLTLVTHSLRTLLLPNCKALANIHASAAAPAGATASTTAGATAVDDEATAAAGRGGRQQMVQDGGGSSRGGSSGRRLRVVLDTKGCVSLTAEGRARLAAAMAV